MLRQAFYLPITFFNVLISSDGFLKSNLGYGCRDNVGLSNCGATIGRISTRTKM